MIVYHLTSITSDEIRKLISNFEAYYQDLDLNNLRYLLIRDTEPIHIKEAYELVYLKRLNEIAWYNSVDMMKLQNKLQDLAIRNPVQNLPPPASISLQALRANCVVINPDGSVTKAKTKTRSPVRETPEWARKDPNECPCGIHRAQCTYHG